MRFVQLASEVSGAVLQGHAGTSIDSICYDSRSVRPGSIFVAVPGFKTDGHDYLSDVLAAGASAVCVQADLEAKWRPALTGSAAGALIVPDSRIALAQIAVALLEHPARRLMTVGVTGTDGKTSLSSLLAHVFTGAGQKAGLISTAECRIGDTLLPDTGRFTTPEAPEVQQMLSEMVAAGCRCAVIEATSHGLALHRVDGCEFDIAVLTNLSADHMDFHGSVESYMAAKGRLFQMLDGSVSKAIEKTAIINLDDPSFHYFKGLTKARAVSYGLRADADVSGRLLPAEGWTSRFLLRLDGREREVLMQMPGEATAYNGLAAAAVARVAGLSLDATTSALESWPGAPGRMELVDEGQPFTVVVDFAHAPESLDLILHLLRERSTGRIIAVFGCIGERDKDRRFRMGRVAAERADYTIVTDDNPYSEDRLAIIEEIADGLRSAGKREGHDFALVPDRREAIAQALAMAVDGDALLLAGKGHEREVHLHDSVYPCHDPEAAREVLRDLGYGRSHLTPHT